MIPADGQPKLLLHVCCGPCATAVIERLRPHSEPECFWYNPNIQPKAEYERRLAAMRRVAEAMNVGLIQADRDEQGWEQAVAGYEDAAEGGPRCAICFEYRLRRATQYAAEHGFTHLATSLAVGPHKNIDVINGIGERLAERWGLTFAAEDFRKQGGFECSVQLSQKLGLYRQSYCGCRFSRRA